MKYVAGLLVLIAVVLWLNRDREATLFSDATPAPTPTPIPRTTPAHHAKATPPHTVLQGPSMVTTLATPRPTPERPLFELKGTVRQHLRDGSLVISGTRAGLPPRRPPSQPLAPPPAPGQPVAEEFVLFGYPEQVAEKVSVATFGTPVGPYEYTTILGTLRTLPAYEFLTPQMEAQSAPGNGIRQRYQNPLETRSLAPAPPRPRP